MRESLLLLLLLLGLGPMCGGSVAIGMLLAGPGTALLELQCRRTHSDDSWRGAVEGGGVRGTGQGLPVGAGARGLGGGSVPDRPTAEILLQRQHLVGAISGLGVLEDLGGAGAPARAFESNQ